MNWPKQGTAAVLGATPDRIDGIAKATGAAKYTYDITPDKMLLARALGCPHGHCQITAIDVSPALQVPGVVAARALKNVGAQVNWEGDLVAVVVGETEGAVAEGLKEIKFAFNPLDVWVDDSDLAGAEKAGRTQGAGDNTKLDNKDIKKPEEQDAEFKRLLDECKKDGAVVEGEYGIHVITHMCLEPHGSTCEWEGDKLTAHLSTQNVSGTAGQFATPLQIAATDVTVHCDYVGGGFGSKFGADSWGVVCAQLAKETGRPVKLMLDRDLELKNAGTRPSGFIQVKIGANKEGVVQVWDSKHWGTSGIQGGPVTQGVIPYVFDPPNRRRKSIGINTNAAGARAWRAPNHPQACAITQVAYDDIARALGIDSYDVFLRNLPTVTNNKAEVYKAEMEIAAKLMDWRKKWHPHGKGPAKGSVVTGLGMAIHTWGGAPHSSTCTVKIHPDGAVETFLGSQDLGTGTRTVIAMVVAETLGLPVDAISVNIGSSKYPTSGSSGGSTTVGGVSESNRRGATDALNLLLAKVAPKLDAQPEDLEAVKGRIQVKGNTAKGLSWKEACGLLGMTPIEVQGNFQRGVTQTNLSSNGVAGVQMAEVAVDRETGVVKMLKFVAVQDMGLIINRKLAASQIYGAVIMGIAAALYEERIMDPTTGKFLNAELADYKLPRLGDTGQIVVELYEPESEYNRGVVGLGEPPVIAPPAAIANAVCNALGVRVGTLPMTPKRVLDAIAKAK
ncbi:MAG: xanthine dehydrogenase family protein molybdopterin-binding subunit [Planctomycetia bacterium]|nr:xanthine dehydrogenase family protein molybdopterin-binding subunit [Planctomycetia bacterium]